MFLSEVDLAWSCCGLVAANLNIHTLAPSYHRLSLLSLQRQNFFKTLFLLPLALRVLDGVAVSTSKFQLCCHVALSSFTANVPHYENA